MAKIINPTIRKWYVLGGVPLYANDTDALSLQIQLFCNELEDSELSSQDILEIFELLPEDLGEDYYGITYRLVALIENYLNKTNDLLDISQAKSTGFKEFIAYNYTDKIIQ